MQKELYLPIAVVVGGAFIGLGLFFGLKSEPPLPPQQSAASAPAASLSASDPRSATSPATPSTVADQTPRPDVPPPPPAAYGQLTEETRAKVEAAAKALVEKEKKTVFVPKCWDPILAKEPAPKTSSFVMEMGFDPNGVEIARSIIDVRDKSRLDIGKCIRAQRIGLKVTPAPGNGVTIDVPLEFP